MQVAIVHDDLVQWGGAERVLQAISDVFPEAPIYTSVYDNANPNLNQAFAGKKIIASFIQKVPLWRTFYKTVLPLYPLAFEQFDFSQFDLVISQTTRFAKSIITKPQTKHVCLCHTPPRFLWHLPGGKTAALLNPLMSYLRVFDQVSSRRVDEWMAGSINCQRRLKKFYRVDSKLLYPFVDDIFFKSEQSYNGGYYLFISRLNDYKNADLVVETFNKNSQQLVIVGNGPKLSTLLAQSKPNISFYQRVDDVTLVELLKGCQGVIVAAEEDFGMVSLEAQAMGKGVIAYDGGGSRESVINGKTGLLFKSLSVSSLQEAIEKYERMEINPSDCVENAARYRKSVFQRRLKELVLVK